MLLHLPILLQKFCKALLFPILLLVLGPTLGGYAHIMVLHVIIFLYDTLTVD